MMSYSPSRICWNSGSSFTMCSALQPICGTLRLLSAKELPAPGRAHLALDECQARVSARTHSWLASKQRLHAQADAQQRLFFRLGPDDRHKAGGHQLVHHVSRKAPTPGRMSRSALRMVSGSAVTTVSCPSCARLDFQAEQVAHAVIQ